MIALEKLNRREAVRYMGGARVEMNEKMESLLNICEAQLLKAARPKVLYKIIELPYEELLVGEDVRRHLEGCPRAAIMCATLGAEVDRLIRVAQVRDMAMVPYLPFQSRLRRLPDNSSKNVSQAARRAEKNRTERQRKLSAGACKVRYGNRGALENAGCKGQARLCGLQPARNL